MFAEAREAGAVVVRQRRMNADAAAALGAACRATPPRAVVTVARGSSDHAATFAKYLIEMRTGTLVSSIAPSVSSLYGGTPRLADVLCLVISQSGRSPDLLAAVDAAAAGGATVAALVNVADSPLAARADYLLPLHAGAEISVAATKSFIAALAAILHLVSEWTDDAALRRELDGLPDLLGAAWDCDWAPLVERLHHVRGLYVLGRGPGLAVAQEAALKFKETCGLHAEAFSAAEVRHGPMALVGPGFPLLVFRQADAGADGIDALISEVALRGGEVLVAGGPAPGAISLPSPAAGPLIAPLLQILSFYRVVNALSVARGYDPDAPPHLRKVTETV